MSKRIIYILFLLAIGGFPFFPFAQLDQSAISPIWGNSGYERNTIGAPLNDPNWAVLPSQQTVAAGANRTDRSNNQRQRYRDASGNPVLTDRMGNIVYDIYGNPAIDSISLNQQLQASGTMSSDADGPALPPDDPVDVPIDGGVEILLILGIGIGYRNNKRKLQLTRSPTFNQGAC